MWPLEKRQIKRLPFVSSISDLVKLDQWHLGLFVDIQISMPAHGPVCDIKPVESVCLRLGGRFPSTRPTVLVRHDFPSLPHLSTRVEKYRVVCLTRRDHDDWWCRKTLCDVIRDVYDWLCDAAAGTLVKDDDPFEPLIVSGTTPVEVNVKTAKLECAKNKGIWETVSEEVHTKDTHGSRFIVCEKVRLPRDGDVPTQVWYQDTEHEELWIDRPTTEEELVAMMVAVGFDGKRIQYWLDRKKKHLHLLMVVGIKRPCHVLGKSVPEEWVAFELSREKAKSRCSWKIEGHLVLESFSPSMAALTSGFQVTELSAAVIGAGALGSEVCEALGRSGIVRLAIVDYDRLLPHNLARHTLDIREVGAYKADAVAERINSLYTLNRCEAIHQNFLNAPYDRIQNALENCDFVLDCSASSAVQTRLADVLPRDKPAFSVFQIAAGKGTVILYAPDVALMEPVLLEAMLVTRFREHALVSEWLDESGDTMSLGGGCSAISSKIPSSIVKFGAGWLADRILRTIQLGERPRQGFVEILDYAPTTGMAHVHRITSAPPMRDGRSGWCVVTPPFVTDRIDEYARSASPNETGGILIGRIDRQRRVVYVTDAWKAPEGSEATGTGFSRGLAGLKNEIAMLERDTNEFLSYTGEWHSHPPSAGTALSSLDSATAKRMARELEQDRIPAVCLITDTQDWHAHVVETSARS